MKFLSARIAVALFVAALSAGCSKTVTWQEEVPLNTGETIWVTRHITYSLQGAGGNPMDVAARPDWKETIEFLYEGTLYKYTGEANLLVLAISKDRRPALIAPASDKDWDRRNNYSCAQPHYVQLVPDTTGKSWVWPEQIEAWTYGLPANLLLHKEKMRDWKKRYSKQDRDALDQSVRIGSVVYKHVNPAYSSETCKRKN